MAIALRLLLLGALAGCAQATLACSCAQLREGTTDAQAFERDWQHSQVVVEADFVSVTITLDHGDPVKDGVLRVRKSFKGRFKTGDLIRTRSNISGAACGWSLRGTPPPVLDVIEKSTARAEPYWRWGAYDRWMLFLSGSAPFQVSTCSRSSPSVLFDELPELLKLQKGQAPSASQPKR